MERSHSAPAATSGPSDPAVPRAFGPIAVVAGLMAGLLAFLVGEAIFRSYQADLFPALRSRPTPAVLGRQAAASVASATATFGALGGLLGLALGLAGGLTRRSALGAVVGLVLGGGITGAVTRGLVPIFFQHRDPEANDLLLPLLTHGAIWIAVGASAGLAWGVGLGRGNRQAATVGGAAGAVLATLAYEVSGAIGFPGAHTDLPLAGTAPTRALAHLLVAGFVAVGAASTVATSKPRLASPRPDRIDRTGTGTGTGTASPVDPARQ